MNHASEDDLLELALRAGEPDAVAHPHLETCADCAARYRAVLEEQAFLRRAMAPAEVPARVRRAVLPRRPRGPLVAAAALLLGAGLGALLVRASLPPDRPATAAALLEVEEGLRRIPAEVGSLRESATARLEEEVPRVISRAEGLYAESLEILLDAASPLSAEQRAELRQAVEDIYARVWIDEDVEKLANEFRETLRTALNSVQYRAFEERIAREREREWEQELDIVIDDLSEELNLRFSEAEGVRKALREHYPKTDLPMLCMAQWPPDRLAGDGGLSGAVGRALPAGYHDAFGRYVEALRTGRSRFEQAARRRGAR